MGRDISMKLKVSAPDAANLNKAFGPVKDAAKKAGAQAGKMGSAWATGGKATPGTSAGASLSKIGGMVGGHTGAKVGQAAEMLAEAAGIGEALEGLTAALGPVGIAAGVATVALGALATAALQFGGRASPAHVQVFMYALEDLQGVIGRTLLPVLELMTEGVRLLGDVLITVLPSADEVRAALQPIRDLFVELRPILADLAPLIKDALIIALDLLADSLRVLQLAVEPLLAMLRLVGIGTGENKLQSSIGAAARPIQFGNIQDFAKEAYKQAYLSSVVRPGAKPKDTRSLVEKLVEDVGAILAKMDKATGGLVSAVSPASAIIEALTRGSIGGIEGTR